MEPLTNKPTDRELKSRKHPLRDALIDIIINYSIEESVSEKDSERLTDALHAIKELIPPDRFKSLTENRSELVEKCVDAVRSITHNFGKPECDISESELRTALTKLLEK